MLSYILDQYILYYNFDTTSVSGVNVYNSATSLYDASLINTASIATTSPSPSPFSNNFGYLQTTSSNYLKVNSSYNIGYNGTTISCWYKTTGSGDIFNSTNGGFSLMQLYISGTSIIFNINNVVDSGQPSYTLYTNAAVNDGNWHHIALVLKPLGTGASSFTSNGITGLYRGTAQWTFYFDGVQVIDIVWNVSGNNRYPDYILRDTTTVGRFTGLIDDFRLYQINFTSSQILSIYGVLLAYYRFDSSTGTNTYDSITLTNVATLNNGASIQTSNQSPISGGYLSLTSSSQQFVTLPTYTAGANTLGISLFFQTNLNNGHQPLINFSKSQVNTYITIGIINNSIYLNFSLTNGIAYTGGGGTFQSGFAQPTNLIAVGGDIAVNSDDTVMLYHAGFNASVASNIYISKNAKPSTPNTLGDQTAWTVPVSIGSMIKLWNVAMTSDASRLVVTQKGGYVFVSILSGSNYGTFTQTSDTTSRTYTGLGMTVDGSRIVCCTNESGPTGNVYMASWNSGTGTYDSFVLAVTGITTSQGYDAICISVDGYKIAYSSGTTCYWATWNGTGYTQQTSFTGVTALNMKFTIDGNILFQSTNSATSGIYTLFFNGSTYTTLTALGGTSGVINKNLLGLCVNYNSRVYLSENAGSTKPYVNVIYWGTTY